MTAILGINLNMVLGISYHGAGVVHFGVKVPCWRTKERTGITKRPFSTYIVFFLSLSLSLL